MNLLPFQKEAVSKMIAFLDSNSGVYNASEQGCISGDALVKINRAGGARTYTIAQAYKKFYGRWYSNFNIKSNIRAWVGFEDIGLHSIKDIIFKGKQEVLLVKTETKTLKLTPDHEILTKRGFIATRDLLPWDLVATDRLNSISKVTPRKKNKYLERVVPVWYPQGHYAPHPHKKGLKIKRRETHILIFEAHLNKFSSLEKYLEHLRNSTHINNIFTVDSSKFHIHHKDENHKNNALANLEMISGREHLRQHGTKKGFRHFNQGIKWEKIRTIYPLKKPEKVFDIVCDDPHRNFVANGIVVHNCGKTIMTIACMNQHGLGSALIFCPVSMLYTWKEELKKWYKEGDKFAVIVSTKNIKEALTSNIVICPYSISFRKEVFEVLTSRNWRWLIMDEAHQLKNRKAQRTKAILGYKRGSKYFKGLWDNSRFRVALSGTPFTNGIPDGYSLFNKLAPEEITDYYSYVGRYCFARRTPWATEYYGIRNSKELRRIIRDRFYIRYTKSEVLTELPGKTYQRITLSPKYAYRATKEEKDLAETIIEKIKKTGTVPVLPQTWQAKRREEAKRKLPIICEFVEDLLKEDVPVVLFAYHREIISELTEIFRKYVPAVICGDTNSRNREQAVKSFQETKTTPLFIGQINASGLGLTLTRSSTVVFAELDYTPAAIGQAADRCHRIGTRENVVAYYFVASGSIEEKIAEVVIEKAKVIAEVV